MNLNDDDAIDKVLAEAAAIAESEEDLERDYVPNRRMSLSEEEATIHAANLVEKAAKILADWGSHTTEISTSYGYKLVRTQIYV